MGINRRNRENSNLKMAGSEGVSGSTTPTRGSVAPKPRVGGGDSSDTYWTGGTNIASACRTAPKSIMARRPEDFRSAEKVERYNKDGLPEEFRLGMRNEKEYPINPATWARAIKKKAEDGGVDSVFLLYDPTKPTQEVSLFEQWGSVEKSEVRKWVKDLREDGVVKSNTAREPVCQWDLNNLDWSGDMVMKSLSFKMWREIENKLADTSGPEIFKVALDRRQSTSTSVCRVLVNKLTEMHLNKEPGMDVRTFTIKIEEVLEQITQCKKETIPTDLATVVAGTFLETGIQTFDYDAVRIYNELEKSNAKYTPKEVLEMHGERFQTLWDNEKWPHKAQKQKQDELSAMKAQLNTLQQKFDGQKGSKGTSNSNKGKGGQNQADKWATYKCHQCGKMGHIKPNCPDLKKTQSGSQQQGGGQQQQQSSGQIAPWMLEAPKQGESEVKTVEGVEYKWCSKCKLGKDKKPMWRSGAKKHVTSECRSKIKANMLGGSDAREPEQGMDGPLRLAAGGFV